MPRDLLPPYEKLTKEQDRAIRYPDHTSLLVIGPPGSGKTVIALFRAQELLRHRRNVRLLVYGNVLHSYIKHSIRSLHIDIKTATFHTWFPEHIQRVFHKRPPKLDKFVYDFDQLMTWYTNFPSEFDQLIIDEGQDIPTDFFRLAARMSKGITVFADENQSIFEGTNSSISQIRSALRRFNPVEVKLTKNFRNTKRIADFANLFMVDGLESGATEPPDELGEFPIVIRTDNTDQQLDVICKYSKQFPKKTIGIFLYKKSDVYRYYSELKKKCRANIQFYYSDPGAVPPDFSIGGIYVVTYYSAKGLEFDAVFVPDAHKVVYDGTPRVKMLLYVVMTRSRERLVISHSGDDIPSIISQVINETNSTGKLFEVADLSSAGRMHSSSSGSTVASLNAGLIRVSDLIHVLEESGLDDDSIERASKILNRLGAARKDVSRSELIDHINLNMTGSLKTKVLSFIDNR